ncbi:MAG: EF-P lysine aminoacylase EpmA [Candidatus Electrothrix sp. Rat3]|nr:EF-P lysine aminoacylase EpmA [Candidatus Electrothrix rattekaaiensis]
MLSLEGLAQRALLIQRIRDFFRHRKYIEVDTPIRLPVLIPEAEIIPLASESWFLQTSPELCMKRVLAQGCSQIFQICPCFRKGERGRLHQEEFTMLEWYHTEWSYLELMKECEQMIQQVAGKDSICRSGRRISLVAPWQRLTVNDAFRCYAGMSAQEAVDTGRFDMLLVEKVEPELGWESPVFLYDYPIELASLARPKPGFYELAERFELYIGGIELANGFSELVDPVVQRRRFNEEIRKVDIDSSDNTGKVPEKFLAALEKLPDCAGIALGLDRLFMLLMERNSLAEVLPFSEADL